MATTLQFLFGLLMATQIYSLQDIEFLLEDGETLTVHETSVKFEDFFVNQTHVESLVGFKVKGAIESYVQNVGLVLNIVNEINLDDKNEPLLTSCDIFLRSPDDQFSQKVFRALKNFIYNTTCMNENGLKDLAFDTIVGNNDVHLNTITTSLQKVKQSTQDSISKYDEHQRSVDTIVDMALELIMKNFNLSYINISDIVTPEVTIRNLIVGNFTTLTRAKPLEIYRKNQSLTVDATFKIKPHILATARGNIWILSTSEMKLTAFADKLEVRTKLNFDYSVEPCRIELRDINLTKEKLAIRMMDEGYLAAIFNTVLPYVETLLTPERLLPSIKDELQKLLDSDSLRSEAESLRPIFSSV